MFSGDIRSERRPRAPPRSRRKGGSSGSTSTRSDALRLAKEGREKRARVNKENTAALTIQRIARGCMERGRVREFLVDCAKGESRGSIGVEGRGWIWGRNKEFLRDDKAPLDLEGVAQYGRNTVAYLVRLLAAQGKFEVIEGMITVPGRVGNVVLEEVKGLGMEVILNQRRGSREWRAVASYPLPEASCVTEWIIGLSKCIGKHCDRGGAKALGLILEYDGLEDVGERNWGRMMEAIGLKEGIFEADERGEKRSGRR